MSEKKQNTVEPTTELAKDDETDKPNVPARPRPPTIPAHESRRRRSVMESLLANGVSHDKVIEIFTSGENLPDGTPGFGMKERGVQQLIQEVYEVWQEEATSRAKYDGHAAQKRLFRHIEDAKDARGWNAVAKFEELLMKIQGTEVPAETRVNISVALDENVMMVLGGLDQAHIVELIQSERTRELASKSSIDAEYEALPPHEEKESE